MFHDSSISTVVTNEILRSFHFVHRLTSNPIKSKDDLVRLMAAIESSKCLYMHILDEIFSSWIKSLSNQSGIKPGQRLDILICPESVVVDRRCSCFSILCSCRSIAHTNQKSLRIAIEIVNVCKYFSIVWSVHRQPSLKLAIMPFTLYAVRQFFYSR